MGNPRPPQRAGSGSKVLSYIHLGHGLAFGTNISLKYFTQISRHIFLWFFQVGTGSFKLPLTCFKYTSNKILLNSIWYREGCTDVWKLLRALELISKCFGLLPCFQSQKIGPNIFIFLPLDGTRSLPAMPHRLQTPKWLPGGPRWPMGSGKGSSHRLLGAPKTFSSKGF